jgi:TrmH family RNA methyltransferase
MFLEGRRLIQEALASHYSLETLIISQRFPDTDFLDPFIERIQKSFEVSPQVFEVLTDVHSPQGVIAIARRPVFEWDALKKKAPAPCVILDGLQDPGNAASIIRTAEAAGAAGVITTPRTAHLFSPKALRGAMGSTLRVPILEHRSPDEIIRELQSGNYALLGTTVLKANPDALSYTAIDWKKAWAIVLGQEGQGLSADWKSCLKATIHIPMAPPVESLNVAASAAVLLYESARQRANPA